jgi:hypothetical protein
MWESVLNKIGIDALKAGLKKAGKQISKREYAELISEAVRELLKLHPDISAAEAKLLAAEALSLPMSADMLKARRILKAVKKEKKQVSKTQAAKKARKKAGKPARKSATKKPKRGTRS